MPSEQGECDSGARRKKAQGECESGSDDEARSLDENDAELYADIIKSMEKRLQTCTPREGQTATMRVRCCLLKRDIATARDFLANLEGQHVRDMPKCLLNGYNYMDLERPYGLRR